MSGRSWKRAVRTTIVVALVSHARPAASLDLVEAYGLAVDNDPAFRAATHEKLATDESLRFAWSKLLPNAFGEVGYTRTRQDVVSSDNAVFAVGNTTFPVKSYGVNLTQPVLRLTEVSSVLQARAEVRQAAAELDASHQDLVFRVADAYLFALGARDELELRERERKALARQAQIARRRLDSGLGIASDLYEAEARFALADADEAVARFALSDAYQALAEITGELHEELRALGDAMPLALPEPGDPARWVAAALRENPLVQAREQAVEVARKEIWKQRSGHAPRLDFNASWDKRDTDGSLFGGGSEVDTLDYGIRLEIPIVAGGGTYFATRRAVELERRERQLLTQTRRLTERETRAAFRAVEAVARRVRALRKTVDVQELAVRSREKAVRAGVDTTINVLNAERELYAALRDHAAARYEYVRNVLRLEQSAGALGPEDLQQVNTWMAASAAAEGEAAAGEAAGGGTEAP